MTLSLSVYFNLYLYPLFWVFTWLSSASDIIAHVVVGIRTCENVRIFLTDFIQRRFPIAGKKLLRYKNPSLTTLSKSSSVLWKGQQSVFILNFRSWDGSQNFEFPSFLLLSQRERITLRCWVHSSLLPTCYQLLLRPLDYVLLIAFFDGSTRYYHQ